MSRLLHTGFSVRTSLTILKRSQGHRICGHIHLQDVDRKKKSSNVSSRNFSEYVDKPSRSDENKKTDKLPGIALLENLADSSISVTSRDSQKKRTHWTKEHLTLMTRIEKSAFVPKKAKNLTVDSFKDVPKQTSLKTLLNELEDLDIASILNELSKSGKTLEAVDILFNYLHICNKLDDAQKPEQLYDVDIFNCIHRALAKEGNIMWMEQILTWMTDQTVTPTLQTYAHFLECYGRSSEDDAHHSKILDIIHQLQAEGLVLEDLYNNCTYISDEWTYVRKAVETVIPNFKPRLIPEKRPYNNPLLSHLDTAEAKKKKIFNPNKDIMKGKQLSRKFQKRLRLEKDEFISLMPISQLKKGASSKDAQNKIREMKNHWAQCFARVYHLSLKDWNGHTFAGYLGVLKPKEFADTVLEVVELLLQDSLKSQHWTNRKFAWSLGSRLMRKSQYFYMEKYGIRNKVDKVYKEYAQLLLDESELSCNHREMWESLCNKHMDGPTLGVLQKSWSPSTQLWVGYRILDQIKNTMTISVEEKVDGKKIRKQEPALFETLNRNVIGKCFPCNMPHPQLLKLYAKKGRSVGFQLLEMPFTIPPVPWTSLYHGVHLMGDGELIRKPYRDQELYTKLAMDKMSSSDILPIFDVLNYMGSCPWKINQPVLDIQTKVFHNNGNKQMNVPLPAPPMPASLKRMRKGDKKKNRQTLIDKYKWQKKSLEMNSLWYSCLWMLTLANEFRDQVFWLPTNMDYRGRVYCYSTILQYQSDDMTRSLFLFAKGKPLGEKGLDWLKIHLINLKGIKKRHSNKDRLAYANEMMEEILDSAENPLEGRMWWLEDENPWQALACCKEIAAAFHSKDHTKFVSHFPVHQDGSCNGLQHYAALGRDKSGAESVNLEPSDVPNDVYSDIMEMVELQIKEDERDGSKIAKLVAPYITRKVVKRPIMTSVYGVTSHGANLQVLQVLKEMPDFPEEHLKEASAYISKIILSNLKKSFENAGIIQDWFNAVAMTIGSGLKKHVEWKTPLGLLVVQVFNKTFLKKNPVTKETRKISRPDTCKQKNSFSPNYIHSLDSVHMMLTALHCMKEGIVFSSIHDCFWTHACDIDTMNKICREQFITLHSQPLLQQLSDYMLEAHKEELMPCKGMTSTEKAMLKKYEKVLKADKIKLGDFELEKVLDSEYFFS
ncbi:DNA-directed RNA polymerase, mitochondrial-like [Ylistrum balloti]|uniref:DNA-directed RNA polymerase, mitochondrial-like n=1 Tax=Ylistrum balloti TaxID=509963 RepID=UPI002905ECD1|nr:DNA-directed RNA polymerase, mitochondrial-like [Ylistrum balloti]